MSVQDRASQQPPQSESPKRVRRHIPTLNFSSDPDDHCETSLESYEQVKPLLLQLCKRLRKDAKSLRIYDPYFCTGQTKQLLASLGFEDMYNKRAPLLVRRCSQRHFALSVMLYV
jgi:hypothetical protein